MEMRKITRRLGRRPNKKSDPLDCQNYRGITLLKTAYKVFSNILYERLKPHVEKVIGMYQCAFRSGKFTVDQIHTLRQILEKTKEYNVSTYHLFVDYKLPMIAFIEINYLKL
jgi:sorting nexin-29